jgi:DNA-binding transcriptional ArsR family regulator
MQLSTLRETVRGEFNSFAWEQWARLGVFAPANRRDRAAADPEALLLFTFEIGRDDSRLFDEVLDWLLTNQALISVQRLRNLCVDDNDRQVVEGALGWVARWRPSARLAPKSSNLGDGEPRQLFRVSQRSVQNPDPAFAAVGLVKPDTEPSRKSRPPDPLVPISFALRLRLLFGVGSRAEVIRYLFTNPAGDSSANVIAEAAGYAKRNISETLTALVASGIVAVYELGNEHRYSLNPLGWNQVLGLTQETWPTYRPWLQLLRALRRLSQWINDPRLDQLTPYLLASEARELVSEIEADLNMAGIAASAAAGGGGEEYWDTFADMVERVLASLNTWWA